MSELKKIEHEGKVYQIGAIYEFSDCGRWITDVLVGLAYGEYPLESVSNVWLNIRECQSPIGTITDAPLKLEDGEWYMCSIPKVGLNVPLIYCNKELRVCEASVVAYYYEAIPLYKMIKA